MALAPLSAGFQSLPPLPTIKLGLSGAASRVGRFVYILGPCVSPRNSPVRLGVSLAAASTPTGVFSQWFEAYFPMLELWVALSVTRSTSCCLSSQLKLCPPHSTIRHLAGSASCHLAVSPLCPGYPSPPLLLVWMNVSSLSPWLSDFHTVRFVVSSGCFLFLNCYCPSFCCARRHSLSTYTSILAE